MSDTITLTRVHNPIDRSDRSTVCYEYRPGLTVADVRADLPTGVEFAISVNGRSVADDHHLSHLDHIVCVPVFAGGSDGKQIGSMIAMIVIAAAAWQFAPMLAFDMGVAAAELTGSIAVGAAISGTIGTGLIAGSLMVAGGLLVNAAFGTSPKIPSTGLDFDKSQSYSWQPQTIQQQGMPISRYYGTMRVQGNVISAHLTADGTRQYLNALVCLGLGPVQGISDFWINDQPVVDSSGSGTYKNVTFSSRTGSLNQEVVPYFSATKVERSVNVKVTASGGAYTYTTPGDSMDAVEVELSAPAGLWYATDGGGMGLHQVEMRVEIRKQGTTTWHPISSATANYSFTAKVGWSAGYWIDVPYGDDNAKAWKEVAAGESEKYYLENNAEVPYFVDYHEEGSPYTPGDASIFWHWFNGETIFISASEQSTAYLVSDSQKVYRRTFRADNLTSGKYEIRVTRITADQTSTRYGDSIYLTTVREVVSSDLTYPRLALCGINALATDQLSGSLRFSCKLQGALVRVYNGSTWSIEYSSNPAWVMYDILTQPVIIENITGSAAATSTNRWTGSSTVSAPVIDPTTPWVVARYDGIDPAKIDTAKFYELAQYCAELVPDGNGGTEPRFAFNGGFDREQNMWEAALAVGQSCFAVPIWSGSRLTLIIDKPGDPVQLFSVGNTGVDSFSEKFLPMSDRAAEIEMDFLDEAKDYSRTKCTVINSAIDNPTSKVSLQMIGVTRESQAWRMANRRLAYNQYITRVISWQADIDAIACQVGDVVLLQSDVPQWGNGGRLVSASSTQLVLDTPVVIASGTTYSVMVRTTDGTIQERAVTTAPGSGITTITVATAFSPVPQQYDVWAFGETSKTAKPVKITDIQRSGDLKATLTACDYYPAVYDTDSAIPTVQAVNYAPAPAFVTISGLAVVEQVGLDEAGSFGRDLIASWQASGAQPGKYEVYLRQPGLPWSLAATATRENATLHNVLPETAYEVKVVGVDTAGIRTPNDICPVATITTSSTTSGVATLSDLAITGLAATFTGRDAKISWNPLPLAGVVRHYQVAVKNGAQILRTAAVSDPAYSYTFGNNYDDTSGTPLAAVTIYVSAVDISGAEGAAASVLATNSVPAAPTALTGSGETMSNRLTVAAVAPEDFDTVEIWSHTANNRSAAALVGTTKTGSLLHTGLGAGDVRYYWARQRDVFGQCGTWYPVSDTGGVAVSSLANPSSMIDLLTSKEATSSTVSDYLSGKTSLVNVLDTRSMVFELGVVGPGITATYTDALKQASSEMNLNKSMIVSIQSTLSGLVVTEYNAATTYSIGQIVTYSGQTYQAIAATTGNLPTNTTYWKPLSGLYDLVNTVQQNLDTLNGSFTSFSGSVTTDLNALNNPTTGRVTIAENTLSQHGGLFTDYGLAITGPLAVLSGVFESGVVVLEPADVAGMDVRISQTRITNDTNNALISLAASQIDGLTGRMSSAEIAIDGANAAIALKAAQSDLTTLDGTVGTHSGELDILKDRITLKLDSNGNVAGMVMTWNESDQSEIGFVADKFLIVNPSLPSDKRQVFTVGNINGVGSVGINGNLIVDGTILARHIATGQLTVGSNVGLGTAQDSAGVTTIVGNTVTTSYVNALNVTAASVNVTTLSAITANMGTITAGTINIPDTTTTTEFIALGYSNNTDGFYSTCADGRHTARVKQSVLQNPDIVTKDGYHTYLTPEGVQWWRCKKTYSEIVATTITTKIKGLLIRPSDTDDLLYASPSGTWKKISMVNA